MTSASTYSDDLVRDDVVAIPTTADDDVAALPPRRLAPPPESLWLHGEAPATDAPRVEVGQAALRAIRRHAASNRRSELGGVLLGHAFRRGDGTGDLIVEVRAALPADSDDHGPIHFTFTADAWAQIHRDRDAAFPELAIVGWYHTHPDLGVFYSADDVVVHSAAFVLPWHVGLVVDPCRHEAAFFGWRGEALTPLAGYYEQLEEVTTTVVPWRMPYTTVWQAPQIDMEALSEAASRVYAPDAPGVSFPPARLWLLPLAGLLSVIILTAWLLSATRRIERLEAVSGALAAEIVAIGSPADAGPSDACPDERLQVLAPVPGRVLRAGERYVLVGRAEVPEAAAYRLAVRPAGAADWVYLGDGRGTELGALGAWSTGGFTPGTYEVRLTAVQGDGQPIVDDAGDDPIACLLQYDLAATS